MSYFLTIWQICAIIGFTFASVCPIIKFSTIATFSISTKNKLDRTCDKLSEIGLLLIVLPATLLLGFVISCKNFFRKNFQEEE